MGQAGYIGLASIAAGFAYLALKRGLDLRDDNRERASLFWFASAFVPLAAVCLIWTASGDTLIMAQRITLGVIGAFIGGFLLVALGEWVRPNSAEAIAQTASAPMPDSSSGSKTNSLNQQGGITAGNIGTVIMAPPAAQREHSNGKAISVIAALMAEGEAIRTTFEQTNNVDLIRTQYEAWFAKVQRSLTDELDVSYAIQFRNAPSVNHVRVGMAMNGAGYWQHLSGQLPVLAAFITDLRRR